MERIDAGRAVVAVTAVALAMLGAWLAWYGGSLAFGDDPDCSLDCISNLFGGVVIGGTGVAMLVFSAVMLGVAGANTTKPPPRRTGEQRWRSYPPAEDT